MVVEFPGHTHLRYDKQMSGLNLQMNFSKRLIDQFMLQLAFLVINITYLH